MLEFDLFVIGSGPAGQRAAIQASKLGKKVAICDRREFVGGVCLNTGTIPSKTLREAALYLSGYRQRAIYGKAYVVKEKIRMEDLLFRCNYVLNRELEVVVDQLQRNRVELLNGLASFAGPHEIRVTSDRPDLKVRAEKIVIATGTTPAQPKGIEIDGENLITSNQVLCLKEIPRSMTVVGAGVIGTEYASIFAAIGVKVTLIDGRKELLEFVDDEIADDLAYQLRNMNCTLRLGEKVESVVVEERRRIVATMASGKRAVSELLLYSIGRRGATDRLNLKAAGLSSDSRGRLTVDEHYRTEVPHIYAAGDVIGFPALASTSMEQGRLAACHAFDVPASTLPHLFPYGIYAVPEISMVGKTEEALTEEGIPYETGIARYREIARGAILGDDTGVLKLLFHRTERTLLGVHAIGTNATELIHIGQAVLTFGGTIDYFVNSVFNYPTFAECYKVAALDGYNKIGPPDNEVVRPESALDPGQGTAGSKGKKKS